MATYKVTSERDIAGKISKGLTVQIIKSLNTPNLGDIMKAYETQFGITVNCSVVISYFKIELVK